MKSKIFHVCFAGLAAVGSGLVVAVLDSAGLSLGATPASAQERTLVAESGAWRIEGNVTPGRPLSYVLSGTDQSTGVSIELWCQPAQEDAVIKITGPFPKNWWLSENVYVTYAPDAGSPKEAIARMYGSNEVVLPRKEPGLADFWKALHRAKNGLHLSVRDVPAIVDTRGFAHLDHTFRHMCLP